MGRQFIAFIYDRPAYGIPSVFSSAKQFRRIHPFANSGNYRLVPASTMNLKKSLAWNTNTNYGKERETDIQRAIARVMRAKDKRRAALREKANDLSTAFYSKPFRALTKTQRRTIIEHPRYYM